jgi:hypothetical protein
VRRIEGAKNLVNGVEQNAAGNAASAEISLDEIAKIINVHTSV